jgi:hypothetical protein
MGQDGGPEICIFHGIQDAWKVTATLTPPAMPEFSRRCAISWI